MSDSTIRYYCYPRTKSPPEFTATLVSEFRNNEDEIATKDLDDGLKSDEVLAVLRPSLENIGFQDESGDRPEDKIHRPVLFGENGEPDLEYEVGAYHARPRTATVGRRFEVSARDGK